MCSPDKEDGELRRFTPRRLPIENEDYRSILTTPGVMAYLVINPTKGKFGWTKDLVRGKRSAKRHFPNCEGIDRRDKYLYVVCKARKEMFILNLDDRTYVKSSTVSGALGGQPDQIVRLTDHDHPLLYFTEDGELNLPFFCSSLFIQNKLTATLSLSIFVVAIVNQAASLLEFMPVIATAIT
mmetsp:Transcript_6653/g.15923  ORF Transcript_6653/g.15923 Transcript_6653/m.15923 type:complete len:182 (-) Transcript_6653:428-973(-)